MLKDISHFKSEKQMTRNEIRNSQREQGSNKWTKLPTLFMMAHKVPKGNDQYQQCSSSNDKPDSNYRTMTQSNPGSNPIVGK
jgi:hypothetical protein